MLCYLLHGHMIRCLQETVNKLVRGNGKHFIGLKRMSESYQKVNITFGEILDKIVVITLAVFR